MFCFAEIESTAVINQDEEEITSSHFCYELLFPTAMINLVMVVLTPRFSPLKHEG